MERSDFARFKTLGTAQLVDFASSDGHPPRVQVFHDPKTNTTYQYYLEGNVYRMARGPGLAEYGSWIKLATPLRGL